jgi:hypothetical protein
MSCGMVKPPYNTGGIPSRLYNTGGIPSRRTLQLHTNRFFCPWRVRFSDSSFSLVSLFPLLVWY